MKIEFFAYTPEQQRAAADFLIAWSKLHPEQTAPEQPQPAVGENTGSVAPVSDSPMGEPAGQETTGSAAPNVEPVGAVKRTRRTKAEMEAARAAEAGEQGNVGATSGSEAPPVATSAATAESPTADVKAPTLDDVRAALQRYTAANSMPQGIALLKNYGASRISELDIDQYALFIAECDGDK